jgi:transposase InsO family protein
LQRFDARVRYAVLRLRLAHPRWGPNRLRFHLGRRASLAGLRLPSESQIGRYLHQWSRFRRRAKGQRPATIRPPAAERVHQRWQVDFKMGIALADGSQVNLHTVRDEVGAVCIAAQLTAAGALGEGTQRVSHEEIQATLRTGFARWGVLPEEVQTDHEALFVGLPTDAFPSRFTLWLAGLGIRHVQIRTGQPTDNAAVERCHRTLNEYVLTGKASLSLPDLQAQLDQALHELAYDLSSNAQGCHGQPPVLAHPQLMRRPLPFLPQGELALFRLERVDAFLAQFTWQRKVSKTGQISIGAPHQAYTVGRPFAQQHVLVRFDPQDRHFVFFAHAAPDRPIARRPARHLSLEHLTGLQHNQPLAVPVQIPLPLPLPA